MINESEISACVRKALDGYFKDLEGEKPSAIYEMVVGCVEKPLLQVILDHAQGNQTRAAEILGLNRNTLRKKMKTHGIK
ncbi:MAG: helix-turn-helix domain-containing protein [Sulfuricella sp.]|jgi:Fis family transcriptional regulator|nr:helix-turn-helix domain-containing protein [Sulfuricella sp.]